jgi:hypothetical protein
MLLVTLSGHSYDKIYIRKAVETWPGCVRFDALGLMSEIEGVIGSILS